MRLRGEKLADNASVEQPLVPMERSNVDNSIHRRQNKSNTTRSTWKYPFRKIQERGILGVAMPKLVQIRLLRHEPATLIDSSTTSFGNECIRLVNIAFHTSHLFPSIMGTYDDVCQYIQEELLRKHPNRYFRVVVDETDDFHFENSEWNDFAILEQEQYRVLILSTRSSEQLKNDTHEVNTQTRLQCKSVVFKRLDA